MFIRVHTSLVSFRVLHNGWSTPSWQMLLAMMKSITMILILKNGKFSVHRNKIFHTLVTFWFFTSLRRYSHIYWLDRIFIDQCPHNNSFYDYWSQICSTIVNSEIFSTHALVSFSFLSLKNNPWRSSVPVNRVTGWCSSEFFDILPAAPPSTTDPRNRGITPFPFQSNCGHGPKHDRPVQ